MINFKYDELPDVLRMQNGEKVETVSDWEQHRRPEILSFFKNQVFGAWPENPGEVSYTTIHHDDMALDGIAVCDTVQINFKGPYGEYSFPFFMFIPKCRHAVPATLLISNRSKEENLDITRKIKSDFWPVEEIVQRGVAACAFYACDVDTDADDGFVNGIHHIYTPNRGPHDWATIASWAWGAMRVMDYFVTDSRIDDKHVAVVGQSRGGKTAILCGAFDQRFAAVYSSCSGCVGAALSRFKEGEHLKDINTVFPYWFCDAFKQYNGKENELPFDQHELLAAIAPRMLYVSSATIDDWADPEAELAALCMAEEVYSLYGIAGMPEGTMNMDRLVLLQKPVWGEMTCYRRRVGIHDLTKRDWMDFLDFFLQRI